MALTLLVPPGIGDFSAMYQKLACTGREIIVRPSADVPERIGPYLDILPKVKNGGYSGHTANVSVFQTLPPGTDIANLPDGIYILAINAFLENGGKVADWIPGPTDYHYDFALNPEHTAPVKSFLAEVGTKRPLIGVYCSAYGNSRHWGFWGPAEWRQFLDMVRAEVPEATFVFIGAEYDLNISDIVYDDMQKNGIRSYYVVGAFHISGTVELISQLDYFFVFPSGLGFLADVVRTPNLMWFPGHLQPMQGTFCDPEQYASGRSMHRTFASPAVAFQQWKEVGLKHMEEQCLRLSQTNSERK